MTKNIRPIYVVGDDAFITLTKGYVAVIDRSDVPLVNKWNWRASVQNDLVYAVRKERRGGKEHTVRLHRAILSPPAHMLVDHKSCDGLDCRRSNLRLATHSANQHNQRTRRTNTSGFKGVSPIKITGRWRASIAIGGVSHHLGCFATREEAHAAYVAGSANLHGEFGRTS